MERSLTEVIAALTAINSQYELKFDGWFEVELEEGQWSWFEIMKDGYVRFDHTTAGSSSGVKRRKREKGEKYLTRICIDTPPHSKSS